MLSLLLIPQRYEFSSKSQHVNWYKVPSAVVADTTKVRIFKQITTFWVMSHQRIVLLLIPQRYEFSSKSQLLSSFMSSSGCCCWYHKGTNFQANHNKQKEITMTKVVVADTTKVRIFKQITTGWKTEVPFRTLLLIPQRYEFSSKSQHFRRINSVTWCCCWYHKGTNFQANHNNIRKWDILIAVVADTTKVRIFKQITTCCGSRFIIQRLLLIPQRYEFSSKSQQTISRLPILEVVADTTKVRIFKQITTNAASSIITKGCCWYHKGTNFQANHN